MIDEFSYALGKRAASGGGGGGGGSGGEVLVVTYTLTGTSSDDGGTATCDHTLAQILSAISAGKFVVAKVIPDQNEYESQFNMIPISEFVFDDPDAYFEFSTMSITHNSPPLVHVYNTWIDHYISNDDEVITFKYEDYMQITGNN